MVLLNFIEIKQPWSRG